MRLREDWVESPQAVHNRVVGLEQYVAQLPQASPDWVADLERQGSHLHGPLVSLLRLQQFAPRPVGPPLAVDRPPVAPPLLADPVPTPRRSPEQDLGTP
ncbi:hypothetical protein PC129_g21554 [Phytophthora cactorum]|uniref:Uncharacterized protein n=1 Tax=Phytophthora cactorum TaxID=29920 RepID=A0A329RGZ7_9STRA|nr:hypothetical protein Pcac1_g14226 [Phytophthora cactorum]KAG2796245.1 hypothetical protein PC111_g21809 [Phytophthora cactorum]KAG2796569.1 hypothetical protein PC112_g22152 [Phytophthora cactorum]KAG2823594.1 hypothetical protein PC113_g22165 [Phytophthora cactorum]KAG2875286.1 hypothetical protein PC114_g24808 [Phytophthora cactorum]